MKQARIIKSYQKLYADPVTLSAGERVRVTKQDLWDGVHLWWWCISDSGKEGWVHESFLIVEGDSATARRDYTAIELTVTDDEIVTVLDSVGGWYWIENASGQHGWIPVECVEI